MNPLNKSEQSKRALNGDLSAVSRLVVEPENQHPGVDTTDGKSLASNQENLLKKFSFLNKDKGYLSKLSSYVAKNFANVEGASLVKSKPRNANGMVFTKIDLNEEEDDSSSKDPGAPYMNSTAVNRNSVMLNKNRVSGFLKKMFVNTALLESGTTFIRNLLSGQNFLTPELFTKPVHASIRKKCTLIRKRLIQNLALIRNKFNRILNFFHIIWKKFNSIYGPYILIHFFTL